ncbi:MAG: LytR C-terminal domain-containing protein [Ilumatobacteraceae bacterium]
MDKRWPILAGIAVVGAVAGVAVAGQDARVSTFVVAPATQTTSPGSGPASTVPPLTITSTTVSPTVTVPATTAPPTAPTTAAPVTTTAPTEPPTTTTTVDPATVTLARNEVRLVVSNGDGRFNLAGANTNRLLELGYVEIDQEDSAKVDATVLYYRPGFEDEAAIVAADLLIPDAILEPLPDTEITGNDAAGDVIIILGPDAKREELG